MLRNCVITGTGINADDYHKQAAERGSREFAMSPSSLKAFRDCPSRWRAGYQPPDSEAKAYGSLLDTLLLTPEQFGSRYAIKPATYKDAKTGEAKPFNMNANVCKAWAEEQGGKEIISIAEHAEAQAAVKRLLSDETISGFHNASDKQVKVVGEWHDEATGLVIPLQCLIDYVPRKDSEFQKALGDLKTTRNAGCEPFARWCYQAGYHVQAAFDLDLYQRATRTDQERPESGEDRLEWIFILQENFPPFETGRRLLSQDFTTIGRQTYEHALRLYARCLKSGIWSGYDKPEEFTLLQPQPWMEFNALSETMQADQEEAMESEEDSAPFVSEHAS